MIENVDKRIRFLKDLYDQGKTLPCEEIVFDKNSEVEEYPCPVCASTGEIEVEWFIDIDYEDEIIFPILKAFKCDRCKFTLLGEIAAILDEATIQRFGINSYQLEENTDYKAEYLSLKRKYEQLIGIDPDTGEIILS